MSFSASLCNRVMSANTSWGLLYDFLVDTLRTARRQAARRARLLPDDNLTSMDISPEHGPNDILLLIIVQICRTVLIH